MMRFRLITVSLAAVLTVGNAWPQAAEKVRVESPQHPYAFENVPSYVATLSVQDPSLQKEKRRTVTRQGNWIREDRPDAKFIIFSNLATGLSFDVGVDDAGHYQSLRPSKSRDDEMPSRKQTDLKDVVLGEPCDVWNMSFRGSVTSAQCLTQDGIPMWEHSFISQTVVSLERRPSAPDYVRPPNELFDWNYWVRLGGDASLAPALDRDYEVTLTSARGETRIIRRHFPWTYEETVHADGGRTISILSKRLVLYYDSGRQGMPPSLQIGPPLAYQQLTAVPASRPPETITGEKCTWFDTMPGVFDGGREECRSSTGIPLKVSVTLGSQGEEFTATRVTRGSLSRDKWSPPRAAFAWDH